MKEKKLHYASFMFQNIMQWDYSCNTVVTNKKSMDTAEELVEPWLARRTTILSKYTTSEKLSIVTSFLPGGEKGIIFC